MYNVSLTVDVLKKQVRERPKILKKWNPLRMTPTRSYLAYTVGNLINYGIIMDHLLSNPLELSERSM